MLTFLLRAWVALIGPTVTGCSQDEKPSPELAETRERDLISREKPARPDSIQESHVNALADRFEQRYNLAPEDLMAELGEPVSAETLLTTNIHTGERDFIYKYQFKGADVQIYHVTGLQRYLLANVETSDSSEFSLLGIDRSIQPDGLQSMLGLATDTSDDESGSLRLEYETGEAGRRIAFVFTGKKLNSIWYQPYLD